MVLFVVFVVFFHFFVFFCFWFCTFINLSVLAVSAILIEPFLTGLFCCFSVGYGGWTVYYQIIVFYA